MLFANRVDHDQAPLMTSLIRVYTVCYCFIKNTCNCVVANRVDHDQAPLMRSLIGVYTVCYCFIKDTCNCVVANRVDHDQAPLMRSLIRVYMVCYCFIKDTCNSVVCSQSRKTPVTVLFANRSGPLSGSFNEESDQGLHGLLLFY